MSFDIIKKPIIAYASFIGRGITPKYIEKGGIIVINQRCIRNSRVNLQQARRHDKSKKAVNSDKIVRKFDVLINSTGVGTLGRVAQFLGDDEVTVDSHVTIVRPNTDLINPLYFGYILKLNQSLIESMAEGSTGQTELSRLALGDMEINVIDDLLVQEQISNTLFNIDSKIWNNESINVTLESIAKTLFKSWFVDFEPVRAKFRAKVNGEDQQLAAMQIISGKSVDELQRLNPENFQKLAATADLFPNELEEAEQGEIPKGWEWKSFKIFLEKTIGGDWGTEIQDDKHTEKVRVIRGTDIPTLNKGGIEKIPTRYVDFKKLKTRQLIVGDIVIEVSGGSKNQPTGRALMITESLLDRLAYPCVPASFCRLMRPNTRNTGVYLRQHLLHIYQEGKTWLYQNQSTGISNFQTQYFLENEMLPFPGIEKLDVFSEIVAPLINKTTSNENLKLIELRDAILPKLLSGELRINI
jgi:type I restriction enzyme S subunit